jgi:hypothetical protein
LVAAGGLVAIGIGVPFYLQARDKQDELCGLNGTPECDEQPMTDQSRELQADMEGLERNYWIAGSVGAAAIAAGLFLYFRQPAGDSAPAVSAAPSAGGAVVHFSWSR